MASDDDLINELLEQILETNCDPAEACSSHPHLIPMVSERLKQLRLVELQVDKLFPSSSGVDSKSVRQMSTRLPSIDGYDVESVLGSGGMGIVYKARHQKLNRTVALKMLRAGQFASSSELCRFSQEFQAIAKLNCQHIVQVHDVGEVDGRPYFTMEYVEGGSLAERLNGTPQTARQAAEMIATLAEAIGSAHSRGIIHRDLKPANILLSSEGIPKIADFGLARRLEYDPPLTVSGIQLGTPSYMAPEQAMGPSSSIGPAADIYSLGAILYEMLTGRPPFRAESALETQRQVVHVEPVPPTRLNASVPRDLETICLTCLSKQPMRRYSPAEDLAVDLKRFLNNEPILARAISRPERLLRWTRRNPAATGFACAAFAVICLTVILGLREYSLAKQGYLESEKWAQRLEFVTRLEREGRFLEARAILGRVPDGGSTDLRERIERAQIELELAEKLQAIRMLRGKFVQGGGIDYAESCKKYEADFREAGFGSVDEPPANVAERINRSAVRVALIEALDDWAVCAEAKMRDWILKVAKLCDPDPWRDEVRSQEKWASLEHLKHLSEIVDVHNQPVTLMVAMGTRWRRLGGEPTAYLRRIHRDFPNDFWLNFELAVLLSDSDNVAAFAYNRAALAIRPDAEAVHFNLGVNLSKFGQNEEAGYHFARVIELDPCHSWAELRLGYCLFNIGEHEESIAHFQRALELDPSLSHARNALRMALVKLGRLEAAAKVWKVVLDNPLSTHGDVDGYAELCLYLHDEAEYQRVCEMMLARFGDTSDPFTYERIGRACLLKPSLWKLDSSTHIRRATELIDRAMTIELRDDQLWARPYIQLAKAFSEIRLEHYDQAIAIIQGDVATTLPPTPSLLLAIALNKTGKSDEAKLILDRIQFPAQRDEPATSREDWIVDILSREVSLIFKPPQ